MKNLILLFSLFLAPLAHADVKCEPNEKLAHFTTATEEADLDRLVVLSAQGRVTFVMKQDYDFDLTGNARYDVLDLNGRVAARFKKFEPQNINPHGYRLAAGQRLPIVGLGEHNILNRNTVRAEILPLFLVKSEAVKGFHLGSSFIAVTQAPFIICVSAAK